MNECATRKEGEKLMRAFRFYLPIFLGAFVGAVFCFLLCYACFSDAHGHGPPRREEAGEGVLQRRGRM